MHRLRLAEQAALLDARPGLDAVGCHVRFFPRREVGPGYRNYEIWLNGVDGEARLLQELFVECPVAHPTLMIRRELALETEGKLPSHIIEVDPGRLGNRIHGAPVLPPSLLPELPRLPVVVSVAGAGPRREIRDAMAAMGFRERVDFICAA